MKKTISLILVLVLLIGMRTTVLASSITDTDTGNSQEVLASYEDGAQNKIIISVDIGWNEMSFTYKGASELVWDATNHQYVGEATEAGWAASDATITITNHSNSILQAIISYDSDDAYSEIFMHFTDAAPYVGSAYTDDREDEDGNKLGTPCTVTVKAIPDGALPADTTDNTRIGVVTVKVTSDIDPLTVVDTIGGKISIYDRDAEGLERGAAYFASETAATEIAVLYDAAMNAFQLPGTTDAEKNVAINALLTAFYGALEIVQ